MSQALINRSPDLLRLQNEEYEIEVCDGYLVVHHIPYLNKDNVIKAGILVMKLITAGDRTAIPQGQNHTAYFVGEQPCNLDGSFVSSLVNASCRQKLYADVVSDFFLSCCPDKSNRYVDYYDKVSTYVTTISSPAWNLDAETCRQIKRPIILREDDSPLVYQDTNASRSNTAFFNERFKSLKVAIVGTGGTGSYLLDFISKTPVAEIHLFDSDVFSTHNAFRAPGAASIEELNQQPYKVEHLSREYGKMHKEIIPHKEKITKENLHILQAMDYVFLCVDSVAVRNAIGDYLIENSITFIDSGLGINLSGDKLNGLVRITTGMDGHYSHIKEAFGEDTPDGDVYASNIQIAELNALAAIYTVIKWKKLLGFYDDTVEEFNTVYSISDNDTVNEKS